MFYSKESEAQGRSRWYICVHLNPRIYHSPWDLWKCRQMNLISAKLTHYLNHRAKWKGFEIILTPGLRLRIEFKRPLSPAISHANHAFVYYRNNKQFTQLRIQHISPWSWAWLINPWQATHSALGAARRWRALWDSGRPGCQLYWLDSGQLTLWCYYWCAKASDSRLPWDIWFRRLQQEEAVRSASHIASVVNLRSKAVDSIEPSRGGNI